MTRQEIEQLEDDLIKYWMEIPQLPNIRKIIK